VTVAVKICGVTRPEDARAAARLGAWAVGLIFVPGTPRCVDEATARRVIDGLSPDVLSVGVFRDRPPAEVAAVAERLGLSLVQLHGAEGREDIERLGPERVIKAVTLATAADVAAAAALPARYLLLDKPKTTGTGDGVGAVRLDLAAELTARRDRILLAGGLTAATVGAALSAVEPWGVDVASGVEAEPRIKDHGALAAFFSAVERWGAGGTSDGPAGRRDHAEDGR